jgi:hypothetical protein
MSVPEFTSQDNQSSSPVLAWPLHPACEAWPEMSPTELKALADDIEANGLRDPITVTPEGKLLDGRNRALACVMAGVTPTFTTFTGDPVLFSLSRNQHRRHMTTNDIAMVAAKLVTTTQGMNRFVDTANAVSIAQAADKAGLTRTAVESAMTVLKHGTPEEKKAYDSGKSPRKIADGIRQRRHALTPPAAPSRSKSVKTPTDPYKAVAGDISAKFSGDGQWRPASKIAFPLKVADDAVRKALILLGDAVDQRKVDGVIEYRIRSNEEARVGRLLVAKDNEIDRLKVQVARLEARIAEQDAEIERLMTTLETQTAPPPSVAPSSATARRGRLQ